jgi:hypothetical protein
MKTGASVDIYESSVRSTGDRGAWFECDDQVGYFYLCDMSASGDPTIVDALRVHVGAPDFVQQDVELRWDATEQLVGLFVRDSLLAAFDVDAQHGYGGANQGGARASIPDEVRRRFEPSPTTAKPCA